MTSSLALRRRQWLGLWGAAAGTAALGVPGRALAQAWTVDTLRVVLGSPPGSVMDAFARRIGEGLRPAYARTVVVENKVGASGQLAVVAVKTASPDQPSLLITPMPMMGIFPLTYKKLPYDPVADFQPVSMGAVFDLALAVGPAVPASVQTLRDFFAWCKANPSQANFGSPAAGSTPHFVGEVAARAANTQLTHVAYRGPTPAILEMVGGQLPAVCSTVGDFKPFVDSGKARLLGTTGATRSRFVPQVPTFAEQGFTDVVVDDWFGFYVHAGTPAATVQRLNAALKEILGSPQTAAAFADRAVEPRWSTPQELAARLQADTARWRPVVKALNFSVDS